MEVPSYSREPGGTSRTRGPEANHSPDHQSLMIPKHAAALCGRHARQCASG